jgi:glycosyltransferase involved in cell wall biosynthesis
MPERITEHRQVLRLLMTADAVGGVWSYALELCRALAIHRVQVLLAIMGPSPSSLQRAEAASLPNVVMIDQPLKLEWMEDCWDDVARAGDWLLSLEQRWKPDLIHLNGYTHAVLPFVAPKLIVAHSCVLSWWNAVYGSPAPDHWSRYAVQVQTGLRAASFVVAPTLAMLNALRHHYEFATPAQVIPNGIASWVPSAKKSAFIAAVGRFQDQAKNFAAIQAIASRLNWPIVAIGDTPSDDDHNLGGNGPLISTGHLGPAEVRDYLASAAIFVSTAVYEPFGLSILEAALSGCALVLNDIPSLRENWNGAAVFVNARDCDQLERALTLIIQSQDQRRAFADRARSRALSFSATRCASTYLGLYQSVLADYRSEL